jgi:hypothetical protein
MDFELTNRQRQAVKTRLLKEDSSLDPNQSKSKELRGLLSSFASTRYYQGFVFERTNHEISPEANEIKCIEH